MRRDQRYKSLTLIVFRAMDIRFSVNNLMTYASSENALQV